MTSKDIRESYNMSQREFAEMIGVTQTAVYKWEKSDVKFNSEVKNKVIRALNLKDTNYGMSSFNIRY